MRILNAENSLYKVPNGVDEKALVMLSDIFPMGFKCGVLNGKVAPRSTVAIIGAGPVGLAALIISQLYSPSTIIVVDGDENRLEVIKGFGATHMTTPANAIEVVKEISGGRGCDTVIKAVGIPASFHQYQELVALGGVTANVGVYGAKADCNPL